MKYVLLALLIGGGIGLGAVTGITYSEIKMQRFAVANGCGTYSPQDGSFTWVDRVAALGSALPSSAFRSK